MPKNHGRIVSIFSVHRDCCPSFYHPDLHANFSQFLRVQSKKSQNLKIGRGVRLCLSQQGPYLAAKKALTAYVARPPSKAGVPPQSGVSPESLDPSICAVDVSLFAFHTTHRQKTQRNRLTQMSWRSLELQSAGNCRAI